MSYRNIKVSMGWPRASTPSGLVPNWVGEFVSFQDWVNFAEPRLARSSDSNGNSLKAICVDALGRRCVNGRDFARARDDEAFPVRFFFDCIDPDDGASPLTADDIPQEVIE